MLQARSDVELAGIDSYCVKGWHLVRFPHMASDTAVCGWRRNWPLSLAHSVACVQLRSVVAVGAVVSYSCSVHSLSAKHTRSDVSVGAEVSYSAYEHAGDVHRYATPAGVVSTGFCQDLFAGHERFTRRSITSTFSLVLVVVYEAVTLITGRNTVLAEE